MLELSKSSDISSLILDGIAPAQLEVVFSLGKLLLKEQVAALAKGSWGPFLSLEVLHSVTCALAIPE